MSTIPVPLLTIDIENGRNEIIIPNADHHLLVTEVATTTATVPPIPILINARIRAPPRQNDHILQPTPEERLRMRRVANAPTSTNKSTAANINNTYTNDSNFVNPLHVTVCQDVSGSLAGSTLQMCQRALNFVVDHLGPRDRFGLVTFGARVREVVPLIEMSEGGRESARRSIYELDAGGNTSLANGLLTALRQEPFVGGRAAAVATHNRTTSTNATTTISSAAASSGRKPRNIILSHTLQKKEDQSSGIVAKNNSSYGYYDYFYTFTIKPPECCTYYEISCPSSPFSSTSPPTSAGGAVDSITASGEVEFELPPIRQSIDKLIVTLFFDDQTFSNVEYLLGEILKKKQTIDLAKIATTSTVNFATSPPSIRASSDPVLPTRVILLFTDGNLNAGTVNAQTLKRQVQEIIDEKARLENIYRSFAPTSTSTSSTTTMAARLNISSAAPLLYTFGFGNDTNASLLRDLAELTCSSFYHISQADLIPRVFADVLGGLFSLVASNVRVRISPTDASIVRIGKVYAGKFKTVALLNSESVAADAGRVVEVHIPNIFEDEVKDILVEAFISVKPVSASCQLPLPNPFAPIEFALTYDSAEQTYTNKNDNNNSNDNSALLSPPSFPSTTFRSSIYVMDAATYNARQKGVHHEVAASTAPISSSSYDWPRSGCTNRFVSSLLHRFQTQEMLERVRESADRGAMRDAKERATLACQLLEQVLADIRAEKRLSSANFPATSPVEMAENTIQLCLSQANHVASTAVEDQVAWSSEGGQQIVNSYASELAVQRNNNAYGVGGSGDVGERARSVFGINNMRNQMRNIA